MKILIGVDGSPYSNAALEVVCGHSWPAGSKVLAISAIPFAIQAYTEVYLPPAATNEDLIKELTKIHEDIVSRAESKLREKGLATEGRVLQGDPRSVIVQAAKEEGADLVVVGSHGRTGLAKMLLGSVAGHVVTHAPCSVLVVKKEGARP